MTERKTLQWRDNSEESVIQNIDQLNELFNLYLLTQPVDVINAVEKRLGKMAERKRNIQIADRLASMGVEIDEDLTTKIRGLKAESADNGKEQRRQANISAASRTELRKNTNRTNARKPFHFGHLKWVVYLIFSTKIYHFTQ